MPIFRKTLLAGGHTGMKVLTERKVFDVKWTANSMYSGERAVHWQYALIEPRSRESWLGRLDIIDTARL